MSKHRQSGALGGQLADYTIPPPLLDTQEQIDGLTRRVAPQ